MAIVFIILLVACLNYFIEDPQILIYLNCALLIGYLIWVFRHERSPFRLIYVWILAFFYILVLETIIFYSDFVREVGKDLALLSVRFMFNANWALIFMYTIILLRGKNKWVQNVKFETPDQFSNGALTFSLLLIFNLFFIATNYEEAFVAFTTGRTSIEYVQRSGLQVVLDGISSSIGLVGPAIAGFYYKSVLKKRKALLYSFLYAVPIFVLLFMKGNRYPLMFSFVGFYLVHGIKLKLRPRHILIAVALFVGFFVLTDVMKEVRVFGLEGKFQGGKVVEKFDIKEAYKSEEAVLSLCKLSYYFQNKPHMYGASSSTILIFWVPRALWKDKPTFIGYWFIRRYKGGIIGYDKRHSVAFTFAGDAFADFGPYFGVVFCMLYGFILAKMEQMNIKLIEGKKDSIKVIMLTMLYPFCFFGVRTISTSLFVLTGALLVWYLFKLSLKKEKIEIVQTD